MHQISGQCLWGTLLKDRRFTRWHPKAIRLVLKPFVESLPEILEEFLNKPVTALNIIKAKEKFLRYCLDNDLDELVIEVFPIAAQTGATLREWMLMALIDYVSISFHLDEFLRIHQTNEDDYVIDQLMLRTDLEEAYLRNQLTIGELLQAIPMIFIRHDPRP